MEILREMECWFLGHWVDVGFLAIELPWVELECSVSWSGGWVVMW